MQLSTCSWHQKTKPRIHQFTNSKCCNKIRNNTPLKRGFKRLFGLYAAFSIGEFVVWFLSHEQVIIPTKSLIPSRPNNKVKLRHPVFSLIFLLVLLGIKFENKIEYFLHCQNWQITIGPVIKICTNMYLLPFLT